MLVDSHCHLDFPALKQDRDGVLARARAAGIGRMINIGTTKKDFPQILATAEAYEDVYCTVGIHPNHAHEEGESLNLAELKELAAHPRVVGIGESGLDYFYNYGPREVQQNSFREHIRAAAQTGLPLVVHSRDAEEDTVAIIKDEMQGQGRGVTGVMHCFSSRRILAEEAVKFGFYISLSGILTFKKSQELRDIVRDVPLDRLLVETDSPYLAPEPFRGRPCEPAYVAYTARVLAEVKGVSEDDIARITTENFFRLFTKVPAQS
jgi:TatD DNase family protein